MCDKDFRMKKETSNRPEILSLHHVALMVDDLDGTAEFYVDTLGFRELETPPGTAEKGIRWFDLGDGRALHLVKIPGDLRPPEGSRAHFAVEVEDADAWRDYLEARGVELIRPLVDLYSAKRIFFRDPSGNLGEFVQWLAGEEA
jgi:glyoxylase I family protein